MNDEAPAQIGHNNPPEPTLPPEVSVEAAKAAAGAMDEAQDINLPYDLTTLAAFSLRVDAFVAACTAWRNLQTIQNAEQSGRLVDFVDGARGIYKQIDERRKSEKIVWDDKSDAVQAAYSPLLAKMKLASDSVKPLQTDWNNREQARINAEKAEAARLAKEKADEAVRLAALAAETNDVAAEAEAARLAKEAAKEAKSASRPTKASATSATGSGRTMSNRTTRTAVIKNQNQVYMHFRDHSGLQAYLLQLCNQAVRSKNADERNVPGIEVITTESAT